MDRGQQLSETGSQDTGDDAATVQPAAVAVHNHQLVSTYNPATSRLGSESDEC